MNWEAAGAIGEIAGSIGVLITLIYFGIQLKKTQSSIDNSNNIATQQSRFAVNELLLSHSELLLRAQRDDELSELEHSQLERIVDMFIGIETFEFIRMRRSGGTGIQAVRPACTFLESYPAARVYFESEFSRLAPELAENAPFFFEFYTEITKELGRTKHDA